MFERFRETSGPLKFEDIWNNKMEERHQKDFEMKSLTTDSALYYALKENCAQEMSGLHVDNLILAGSKEFKEKNCLTYNRFKMSGIDHFLCSLFECIVKNGVYSFIDF